MEESLSTKNVYEVDTLKLQKWSTRKRRLSNENLVSDPPLKTLKSEIENELNQVTSPVPVGPVRIPILCDGFKIYLFSPSHGYPPNTVLKMENESQEEKKSEEKRETFLCDVCWRPSHKISLALLHLKLSHQKYFEGYEGKA